MMGHNGRAAFSLTIFPIDQEDLYVYRTKPGDPHLYAYGDTFEPMQIVAWVIVSTAASAVLVAGAAVQRFWLTATRANLQLQPQHTPLVFAQYARARRPFTAVAAARARADAVAQALDQLLGHDAERAVFLGRLGAGAPAASRSTRLPLASLRRMPMIRGC